MLYVSYFIDFQCKFLATIELRNHCQRLRNYRKIISLVKSIVLSMHLSLVAFCDA